MLLLDEPLAGMTMDDKAEMSDFIRRVRSELARQSCSIEHDIGLVMSLSDRVAVLDYGAKIAEGTPGRGAGRSGGDRRLSRRRPRTRRGLSR